MKSFVFGFAIVGMVSCAPDFLTIDQCTSNEHLDDNFQLKTAKWNKERINVCWDSHDIEEADKIFMQQLVTDAWDANISLDFVGWNDCVAGDEMDIVIIDDTTGLDPKFVALTSDVGMPETLPTVIVLNYEDLKHRRALFRHAILHEFGHVLNLVHEHVRLDTPVSCLVEMDKGGFNEEEQNTTPFGPWDNDSIMNYCNKVPRPSCLDLQEVVFIYGAE